MASGLISAVLGRDRLPAGGVVVAMSTRSYPKGFARPLRETPVATDEDVQRMLERLRRRCKISVNGSGGEPDRISAGYPPGLAPQNLPDGAKPSPTTAASNQAAPASSGAIVTAPTPRGSLPNSLGTSGGSGNPALQWERVNSTAMRTACGTWTCCKVIVDGNTHYELWKRIAGLERPVRVLNAFKSFAEAKCAAEAEMDADNG